MSEEQWAQMEGPTAEMREIFGVSFFTAGHFAQMLTEEGELHGLVGPRELPRLQTRHIVNSAAVVPFLPARGSVADAGSGAGLPGIVIVLLRPDLDIALIETMKRRTQWLSNVVEELGLDNVTIRWARAEEVKSRYDVVTTRVVTNLSELVRLAASLLRSRSALLTLKGMRAQDEVDDTKYVIKKAELSVVVVHKVVTAGNETTTVIEVRYPKSR